MKRLRQALLMEEHVCPWWLAYTFDHRLRRLLHRPEQLLAGLVSAGQTVADIGCGMGFFSIAMAHLVGPAGRVIAVDVQPKMFEVLQRRATRSGLGPRIRPHLSERDKLGLSDPLDFALAFWMVHETPSPANLFNEIHQLLKPGAALLVAEPMIHVPEARFREILAAAHAAGLQTEAQPKIALSRAAILRRPA